jgi:hypothetical protein
MRARYAGPLMDALTVVVNRRGDGAEWTPEEYRAALELADKTGKRADVVLLLEKIAVERNKWHRDRSPRRVNHWRKA